MAVLWEECIRDFQQPYSFQFYLLRFIVQPLQAGCSFVVACHIVCFEATLHCLSALANVASKAHWDVTKIAAFCQVFLQKTSISMPPVLAAPTSHHQILNIPLQYYYCIVLFILIFCTYSPFLLVFFDKNELVSCSTSLLKHKQDSK